MLAAAIESRQARGRLSIGAEPKRAEAERANALIEVASDCNPQFVVEDDEFEPAVAVRRSLDFDEVYYWRSAIPAARLAAPPVQRRLLQARAAANSCVD